MASVGFKDFLESLLTYVSQELTSCGVEACVELSAGGAILCCDTLRVELIPTSTRFISQEDKNQIILGSKCSNVAPINGFDVRITSPLCKGVDFECGQNNDFVLAHILYRDFVYDMIIDYMIVNDLRFGIGSGDITDYDGGCITSFNSFELQTCAPTCDSINSMRKVV
jgi:hypothetical protein